MGTSSGPISDKILLGITEDEVRLGSHLLHFWRTDEEFEIGVRFLQVGMEDPSQYCVLFGHDEVNQRVLELLRKTSDDTDRVIAEGRLVTLTRDSPATIMVARIEDAFSAALRKGASAIRYLGNLGMGSDPLPGRGADDVIELEQDVTALAARFPCVVVCMYDLNTVSGHLLLNAGFASHPFAVWQGGLRENPFDSSKECVAAKLPESGTT